ncbi:MAG TPA: FAD-dependent oxidoreductase [Solirubrobacteraceae bacterium]|jgi:3-phenylpropionate/trans-cinnamate dioxygenase ferredoxin reductase subunit
MPAVDTGRPIVIIGGGLAGGNAAVTLREEGFDGHIVILSREPDLPFGRPPLSKTYLRSEEDLSGWRVKPAEWYREEGVELRNECDVLAVDTDRRSVMLGSGAELDYEKLLLATGGRNRRLQVPGAELPGVHQLRTVVECDAIKADAVAGRRAVIVGMGFIGCEVAASLTQLGLQVTTIFGGSAPLEKVLGAEVGATIAAIHRDNGVELCPGEKLVALEGNGRLEAAVTAGGRRIACDLAVAGIGIEPELPRFGGPAPAASNGLLVDELCRTSAPDVYAAGDVANTLHPVFGRVRVEHYNNAEKQGRAAARSMLGSTAAFDYIHSFWSDQYEHNIEYAGHASSWDRFVVRGSLPERAALGFYLLDGVLQAAVGLNRGGDPEAEPDSELAACARLVAQRARPDAGRLADEGVELWSLVR